MFKHVNGNKEKYEITFSLFLKKFFGKLIIIHYYDCGKYINIKEKVLLCDVEDNMAKMITVKGEFITHDIARMHYLDKKNFIIDLTNFPQILPN